MLQAPDREASAAQRGATKLEPESYSSHFTSLLALELDALATMKSRLVLWKIGVTIDIWDEGKTALRTTLQKPNDDFVSSHSDLHPLSS